MSLQFKDEASFMAWQKRNLPAPPEPVPQERFVPTDRNPAQASAPARPASPPAWMTRLARQERTLRSIRRMLWAMLIGLSMLGWIMLVILGRMP